MPQTVRIATGSINLLHNLQRLQIPNSENVFDLKLMPLEDSDLEVTIQYGMNFVSPPTVDSTLAVEILRWFNWPVEEVTDPVEIAFHFPIDELKFKTVFMNETQSNCITELGGHLVSDSLKNWQFQVDLEPKSNCYRYENFQTSSGFNFLTDIIRNNGNLLIEVQWNKQVFMSIIDLEIFNYEGVCEVKFLLPLYQRHKKTINDIFGQDLNAFPIPNDKNADRKTKMSRNIEQEELNQSELIPMMFEENQVAIVIKLKIPHPIVPELSIEDLKQILNQAVPFIEEISLQDQTMMANEAEFKKTVRKFSIILGQTIDENADLDTDQLKTKIKMMIDKGELLNKQEFKDVLKSLIGNKININKKTETNHEFVVDS